MRALSSKLCKSSVHLIQSEVLSCSAFQLRNLRVVYLRHDQTNEPTQSRSNKRNKLEDQVKSGTCCLASGHTNFCNSQLVHPDGRHTILVLQLAVWLSIPVLAAYSPLTAVHSKGLQLAVCHLTPVLAASSRLASMLNKNQSLRHQAAHNRAVKTSYRLALVHLQQQLPLISCHDPKAHIS